MQSRTPRIISHQPFPVRHSFTSRQLQVSPVRETTGGRDRVSRGAVARSAIRFSSARLSTHRCTLYMFIVLVFGVSGPWTGMVGIASVHGLASIHRRFGRSLFDFLVRLLRSLTPSSPRVWASSMLRLLLFPDHLFYSAHNGILQKA